MVKNDLIKTSGFKEASSLGKYLGVPLLGRSPNRADYQYLIEQVTQRLAGWKAKQLSMMGRITLAKTVLQTIPVYPMMSAALPKGVLFELEKIQRRFVWGDEEGHKKLHSISWDTMTTPKEIGGVGLRKLSTMNTACLLKLGWELRSNPTRLWCQVMIGKYSRHVVGSQHWIHKVYDSCLWKAIAHLESFIQANETWAIGNGKTVNPWIQRWLDCGTSISEAGVTIPSDLLHLCVADLVSSAGKWNIDIIKDWLPEEFISLLRAVPPPTPSDEPDLCTWPNSVDGNYRVADGYKKLCINTETDESKIWKAIWKIEAKERVRHHIWLVNHDRLLTKARLARMHLGTADCPHCVGEAETTLHVLRDCSVTKTMWMHLVKANFRNVFFGCHLQDWIDMNLFGDAGTNNTPHWSAYWANGCYLLWQWRNRRLHDDAYVMPWQPWQVVSQETTDYLAISSKQITQKVICRTARLQHWNPPDLGVMKLNTDGASSSSCYLAGCGGILRDCNGQWRGGFSRSLGYCSPYLAELWGVFEGLLFAHRKGYLKLIVELDAEVIVKHLQDHRLGDGSGWSIMRRIWNILKDPGWSIQFQHVYKNSNKCAHSLAAIGSHQIEDIVYYDVMPVELSQAFSDDLFGVASPRTVVV